VDPEEIAHIAFVEAYRNLRRYRAGTNFFAWLCAIARHRLLAENKRIQRQSNHQQKYLDQLLAERVIGLVEAESEFSDIRLGWLRECIAQLKPDVQTLIEQRYGQCEAIESMARALGRSASALRVQLFSVREKLRECLERKRRARVASG
jgi:RNA polymerase sigma-70 factor (ECF subfamily)